MTKLDPQVERELRRGVIDIIPERDFLEALASGRKLRFKFGLDPSKPDLHIGHGVLLRKLRLLQEMGHQVVLIVGDWTAQIGDPSGQSVMRPMLKAEEVRANAETYMRQFFYVVDKAKTEVRWQSEWFDKFTLADSIRLAARFTVAQMLQREDFRTRYEAQKPLGVHELFYPLLQAYDSVVIESDVEFGGTDQLFNLLVGRELQQEVGQRPQVCITMHLLVGTDGSQKMSKSLGNTIDFEDSPSEKFGKVMSLPDSALLDYLELATTFRDDALARLRNLILAGGVSARNAKKEIAKDIVKQFHGSSVANKAYGTFGMVHRDHEEGEIIFLPEGTIDLPLSLGGLSKRINLAKELHSIGIAASVSDARRLIKQGAVELIGRTGGPGFEQALTMIDPPQRTTEAESEVEHGQVFRVGKHQYLRIIDKDKEE